MPQRERQAIAVLDDYDGKIELPFDASNHDGIWGMEPRCLDVVHMLFPMKRRIIFLQSKQTVPSQSNDH